MRYVKRGKLQPWIPGPAGVNPRPRPLALHDYFLGVNARKLTFPA
jgi:hypothetical protein